jgi:hypothetical protein
MAFSKEEFENTFKQAQDTFLEAMAENSEISVEKFYSMACIMENLYFFSPVLFDLLKPKSDDKTDA